jgi:hypothetical protein
LGICALGWLACAALLGTFGPVPAISGAVQDEGGRFHFGQFVVPLLAGILCLSAVAALAPGARLRRAGVLWATWTLVQIAAVLVPHRLGLHDPWTAFDLLLQQAGLVPGIVLGWLCTPSFAQRSRQWRQPYETITASVIAALSAAIILFPLAPDTPVLSPALGWHINSASGYLKALPGQIYLALKPLVLWVPVGLLVALAQGQAQLRGWVVAATASFVVVGLPLLYDTLRVQDVLEVLGAYWGTAVGIWIGARVSDTQPDAALHRSASPAVSPETSRRGTDAAPASGMSALQAAGRIAAVLLLAGVSLWAWSFPRWGLQVLCALALYALLLARYRHAWLLVVPAALPLLNLAPGTGRFFFDEFDMLMVTTVAMALWHGVDVTRRASLFRALALALALFGLSVAASLVIGLLPLSPLDANAFANVLSHYSSLRIAKGFLWVLPVLALMLWTLPAQASLVMRLFVPGMWLGLAGVIAVGLWERWSFAGVLDLTVPYRITATFSSMHTGGSEIETYLVVAIPFVWLAFGREWPLAVRFAGLALVALGAYLMTLTVSRGGVVALGVALVVLILSGWRFTLPKVKGRWGAPAAAIAFLGGVMILAVGPGGGYWQKRLTTSGEDWDVRVSHWQKALAIRDPGLATGLLGMGLGRFPEAYLFRSGAASLPGTYGFADEDGNRFLRLGGGETLYMAQRVAVTGGTRYTLSLRVRSSQPTARLGIPLCEKHLLNSFRCQWRVVAVPGDGGWHAQSFTIDTGLVGEGNWLTRRPVDLSLYNETEGTRIDIDDVELRDEAGAQLVRNGDFSAGGDYWFFKTHSHLPWHIKNLWVEVLFEQGWLGLLSFLLVLAVLLGRLARAVRQGDRLAGVLLASTSGFLTVGLFGSLFDAPRIATLFFLLVVLAATAVGGEADRRKASEN